MTSYATSLMFVVAAVVSIIARRLKLPYTVGLVATGAILVFFHVSLKTTLTRELIFNALLPPLLFEAAINIPWRELRRDSLVVGVMAVAGVVISAAVVAAGMRLLFHWPFPSALVFGVLIAATDPVSVIATFKDIGIHGRLRLLVEAESLLNDGVAAVLFGVALAFAGGASAVAPGPALWSLAVTVLGGIAVGAIAAGLAFLLAWRSTDHLVETLLTAAVAYGSFLQAEHLHVSGVLATVTAGLLMGNFGILREDGSIITQRGRESVMTVWDFAAFVANSLIFLLIGARVAEIPFHVLGAASLVGAIVLVLAGRMASVYPLCALVTRTRHKVPMSHQHILFWGGLRGALALALALSLPRELAFRDEIVIATFGVVAFSIVVQGVTLTPLMRRLGIEFGSPLPKPLPEGKGL